MLVLYLPDAAAQERLIARMAAAGLEPTPQHPVLAGQRRGDLSRSGRPRGRVRVVGLRARPDLTEPYQASQVDQRCDERDAKHASVPLRRVRTGELRREEFLYTLKAGPADGRRWRPSAAGSTSGRVPGRPCCRSRTTAALTPQVRFRKPRTPQQDDGGVRIPPGGGRALTLFLHIFNEADVRGPQRASRSPQPFRLRRCWSICCIDL